MFPVNTYIVMRGSDNSANQRVTHNCALVILEVQPVVGFYKERNSSRCRISHF